MAHTGDLEADETPTKEALMPKQGMGPIRREQICRSAANVIAERGFPGSTMRVVAEGAGVSTGMLNHYFKNRSDMLTQTLVFVSERMHGRCSDAVRDTPPGEGRVRALIETALPSDQVSIECWRVWIASYGEAVRSDALRETIESRLKPWYEVLDFTLEGHAPTRENSSVPLSWELDALLNGLAIQWLTAKPEMDLSDIEEALIAFIREA
jgi:TetR/AcrR family transcriptional repressor of bet genes